MIPKFFILILLPILLTVVYLGASDDNVVGIIALGIMMVSLSCTIIVNTPLWGALLLIIALHWFLLEGISYSVYIMMFSSIMFFLYCIKKGEKKIDKIWLFLMMSQLGYMALVFVVKPYPIIKIFFFAMITGLFFFLGNCLVNWTSSMVQKLLTFHLSFMVIWAFIERAISYELRIEGPSLSSTNFAVLLAVSWTIWFINGWICKKTHPIFLALMSVLVLISIFFSGTRMGILGMCMGSCLGILSKFIILERTRVLGLLFKFFVVFGVFSILLIGLWNIIPNDLFLKQGLNNLITGKLDASSMGRIAAWVTALDVIKQNPLWGGGTGNFLAYNVQFLERYNFIPMVQTLPRLGHAHNLLLMVLSEHGFIGFITLMIVCVTCAKRLIIYIKKTWDGFGLALFSGGLVTLFLGLFDVFPIFPSSIGWGAWYMAILFSLGARNKNFAENKL